MGIINQLITGGPHIVVDVVGEGNHIGSLIRNISGCFMMFHYYHCWRKGI